MININSQWFRLFTSMLRLNVANRSFTETIEAIDNCNFPLTGFRYALTSVIDGAERSLSFAIINRSFNFYLSSPLKFSFIAK